MASHGYDDIRMSLFFERSQVRRLTNHSQYTSVIKGSLRVHVPVPLYALTLNQSILDQLGGFSHCSKSLMKSLRGELNGCLNALACPS